MSQVLDRLLTVHQYLVPQRFLSRLARRVSECRAGWLKNRFITVFVRLFRVDLREAALPEVGDYPHFNAFFTRALKPGARRWPEDPGVVTGPCDGTVSQAGSVQAGRLIQAKGRDFSVAEVLGDSEWAERFAGGYFATLYLSPRDYHRVHMPLAGRLCREVFIPGRLFSVSERSARSVTGLFARNERVSLMFETDQGPLGVVLVAAMLVSGVETVWSGGRYPPHRQPRVREFAHGEVELARGDELGRFHWGSTVILLRPPGASAWRPELVPGARVRVGQPVA